LSNLLPYEGLLRVVRALYNAWWLGERQKHAQYFYGMISWPRESTRGSPTVSFLIVPRKRSIRIRTSRTSARTVPASSTSLLTIGSRVRRLLRPVPSPRSSADRTKGFVYAAPFLSKRRRLSPSKPCSGGYAPQRSTRIGDRIVLMNKLADDFVDPHKDFLRDDSSPSARPPPLTARGAPIASPPAPCCPPPAPCTPPAGAALRSPP
jgi:hypothetical protein